MGNCVQAQLKSIFSVQKHFQSLQSIAIRKKDQSLLQQLFYNHLCIVKKHDFFANFSALYYYYPIFHSVFFLGIIIHFLHRHTKSLKKMKKNSCNIIIIDRNFPDDKTK